LQLSIFGFLDSEHKDQWTPVIYAGNFQNSRLSDGESIQLCQARKIDLIKKEKTHSLAFIHSSYNIYTILWNEVATDTTEVKVIIIIFIKLLLKVMLSLPVSKVKMLVKICSANQALLFLLLSEEWFKTTWINSFELCSEHIKTCC
jgi:hypothetical protein